MRLLNLLWMSKPEWWELKNHIPVVREDAPPEAQESYRQYLKQKRRHSSIDCRADNEENSDVDSD